MDDAAELLKNAVRVNCTAATKHYSVPFSNPSKLQPHIGFTPPPDITNQACPPVTGSISAQVPIVKLTVTLPRGNEKSVYVMVRTPGSA